MLIAKRMGVHLYLSGVVGELLEFQNALFESSVKTELNSDLELFQAFCASDNMALKHSQHFIWSRLHDRKWDTVDPMWRMAYVVITIRLVSGILQSKSFNLKQVLEEIDVALIIGGPFSELHEIAALIHKLIDRCIVQDVQWSSSFILKTNEGNAVTYKSTPSIPWFRENAMKIQEPHILLNTMDHWPALSKWKNMQYLLDLLAYRTVPVEVGFDYLDDSWSQKLMTFGEFALDYLLEDRKGYLAQFELFDLVGSELKRDIVIPDYCTLSLHSPSELPVVSVNIWIGPAKTISRCHFDLKHNLLCQVVGTKRIKIIHPKYTDYLYPIGNTSGILDLDAPKEEIISDFPNYTHVVSQDCVLQPGEMLYIPPGFWHYVVAESFSISVSFWWD